MIQIPSKIQKIIGNEKYIIDNVGMSGSSVYVFEDKVLKIQAAGSESENEYLMMKWLQVPFIIPVTLLQFYIVRKNIILKSAYT